MNEEEKKFWYYLILIMIVIIIFCILLWILFVGKEELIKINKSLQQSVGIVRGEVSTNTNLGVLKAILGCKNP